MEKHKRESEQLRYRLIVFLAFLLFLLIYFSYLKDGSVLKKRNHVQ